MMKKIIAGAAAAGLILTMAGGVLAFGKPKIEVENKDTTVINKYIKVEAESGDNTAYKGGKVVISGKTQATLDIWNDVNTTTLDRCGVCGRKSIEVENKDTTVVNKYIKVEAESGDNTAYKGGKVKIGGNTIAGATIWSFVNTTTIGMPLP
ncbi:MAG: hypothetical protein V1810_05025 [Candidatus Beckwithbacteria bacterium]